MGRMAIDSITVSERYRQDLGDLSALAASIKRLGLLHPIVVTSDGRLIAGQRRLEACRQLGRREVEASVAGDLDSALALLAEQDENTCRLDLKTSEKVALGKALEALERPKARERQGRRTDLTSGSWDPEVEDRIRDRVGSAVGMSGRSYERAKGVVEAKNSPDPVVRKVAEEEAERMDATGTIKPSHERVREAAGRAKTGGLVRRHPSASDETQARRAMERLAGLTTGLKGIDGRDVKNATPPEELTAWVKTIGEAISALRLFRKQLSEEQST